MEPDLLQRQLALVERQIAASSMPPSDATSSPISRAWAWALPRPPNLHAICFGWRRIICGRAWPSGSGFRLNCAANRGFLPDKTEALAKAGRARHNRATNKHSA